MEMDHKDQCWKTIIYETFIEGLAHFADPDHPGVSNPACFVLPCQQNQWGDPYLWRSAQVPPLSTGEL